MKIEIENLSIEQIDEQIIMLKKTSLSFYVHPATQPISLRRKYTAITVGGLLFEASGNFNNDKKNLLMSITVKPWINLMLTFSGIFFSIVPFVASHVTINSNPNPSNFEKMAFVAILITLLSVFYLLVLSQRKGFAANVKAMFAS